MKIAIGSDHAGYFLKEFLRKKFIADGHDVVDVGTNNTDAVDYPDFARKVSEEVQRNNAIKGIIVCGSGVGASIAANKMKGIRASVCHDTYSAHQGVEHDDMNVLALGARIVGEAIALEIANTFLRATFCREERHQRRVNKIISMENA